MVKLKYVSTGAEANNTGAYGVHACDCSGGSRYVSQYQPASNRRRGRQEWQRFHWTELEINEEPDTPEISMICPTLVSINFVLLRSNATG